MTQENVKTLFESKFVKVFDLQYEEGKHYYDATRRDKSNIVALKSDEEFKKMLPDAVTCVVVIKQKDEEDKLLLSREYRYPAGRFLLSPPAGLIDASDFNPEDSEAVEKAILHTASREIFEETGISLKDTDKLELVNPLLFSSPGMTDESNAIALAVIELDDLEVLTQSGAEGTELFDGFKLVNKSEARDLILSGRDEDGNFYSAYTWIALSYFVALDIYNH